MKVEKKQLRTILIDDEENCLDVMQIVLEKHCPQVQVVARASNGLQGLKAIITHEPDLVFLDIEMPKMDGFQMLEALEQIDFTLVFTTAYDRFAIRAFKFSAFDYLLKPIDEEEVIKTIQNIEARLSTQTERLSLLKEHYQSDEKKMPQRLALAHSKGFQLTDVQAIVSCESDGNYTKVHLSNGAKIMVIRPIHSLEEALQSFESHSFFRIHRQHLVNLKYIKNYLNTEGGQVELTDGRLLPLARNRRDDFLSLFTKF
ncbi:MAG: response regulator [Saprospiraceae bacterium]|nr:response regulator [Saprospiraceae bacterium]